MRLTEFISEAKSPLSLFKKMTPMDPPGKVVPMAIMKKDSDDYFEEHGLEEQPWAHIAANLLGVTKIGDLALVESEDEQHPKYVDIAGEGWKTKKSYKRTFGYDEIATGTIYGVDAVMVSDFGYWAYIIRNADKTKGKVVKEEIISEGLDFNVEQMGELLNKAENIVVKMKKQLDANVSIATFRKSMNELRTIAYSEIPKALKSEPKGVADKKKADRAEKAKNFDAKLSKYWQDYFTANYELDDFTNHGGGSVANAKKKVLSIYEKVKSTYSKSVADKMHSWAAAAYERAYYGRDKKWDVLIDELPPSVDPTWIEEEFL